MSPTRSRLGSMPRPFVIFFLLVVCVLAAPARAQDVNASQPDLICHTSNPEECYPRVFEPTNEFQTVHDDQSIPRGLHVRFDMTTGKKEAKINVPDEKIASLEGLPVDKALVQVEQEKQPQTDDADPVSFTIQKGDSPRHSAGRYKLKKLEHGVVSKALWMVKRGAPKSDALFDTTLDTLEQLSHDLHWGTKIAQDADAVRALLCMMAGAQASGTEGALPRDQQAALILTGALHNNPEGLKAVASLWPKLDDTECAAGGDSLRRALFSSISPAKAAVDGTSTEQTVDRVRFKVGTIYNLIQDASIRADFLESGGMTILLEVLIPEGEYWGLAHGRAGRLVVNTFFDEELGAVPGQWPKVPRLSDEECTATETPAVKEGCWDYHVDRIAEKTNARWSLDLRARLAALRPDRNREERHGDL